MTTTLRPTGPEEREDDGARSRAYDICVNSRPVGLVRLTTDPEYGPTVGRIGQLVVEERERKRGRGSVAALAAEEVLRDWGCRRAEWAVPARAAAGLRLATALGYRERSRHMLHELPPLDELPELPASSTPRAMDEAEFTAWREYERAQYARALGERGVPADQAEGRAEASERTRFSRGLATPGVVVRVLAHEGTDVGRTWLDLRRSPREDTDAWIFSIEVDEPYRGRGHGRTLMLLAEREAAAAGAEILGLNVHADNEPAQRLYTSLGFRTVEHHLYKPLL
ncbi:GNAT family N-acetyltransferase [Streptomyces sp. HNM0574]|uniref:GNAT family N-acetyltransferase n=1 Tax=Streptomyces sp. HNM0574 TaxID=2714954 RepID=UPI00146AF270|nr:GNAT family N-acetyltransferase [Streptomyces sp. HNM0574]NLU66310.1 GNAT family N-acetyltransferase [Streptomyces sp. HNM0574]